MRRFSVSVVATAALVATMAGIMTAQDTAPVPSDTGAFVVLHGTDTVARERFTRTSTELHARLVLTEASHGVQQYSAALAPDATVPVIDITVRVYRDSADTAGRIAQRARVIFKDDSAAVDALTDHGIQTRLFATRRGAIPYINLSFALLEQAVRRARADSLEEVPFFNVGGGETVAGKVTAVGSDSVIVTIGEVPFHLHVDRAGRILGARIPTQNVTVNRISADATGPVRRSDP